jgi:hypothetical protein
MTILVIMKNKRDLKLIHSRSKLAQVFFDLTERIEAEAERAKSEGLPQKLVSLRSKYQLPPKDDDDPDCA